MIEIRGLTKSFDDVLAVDDLSFDVEAGKVTGFLGPNGAGKSTTMRLILGLDRPNSGTALVHGRPFAGLRQPLREVGALLDAGSVNPGRTGRNHLRVAARSNGIPIDRVDEVIDRVGLGSAAGRRIKGYSLGMRQRLGIAAALLGNPRVLLFDEPVNGLDLDGVRWIRTLLRELADEGRTVLVSSHLLSEMQQVADRLVIIGRGHLIADATTDEIMRGLGKRSVRVRSPQGGVLADALQREGMAVRPLGSDELEIEGVTPKQVGERAHALRIPVHQISELESSLEDAYVELTGASVEYRGGALDAASISNGGAR